MNKNILLPGIVGVVALACVIAVNANLSVLKKNLDLERFSRLDAERKLEASLKNTRRIQDELSDAKQKLENVQSIVNEGQSTTKELKQQIEAEAQEKEDLKQAIKKLQAELAASQKAAEEQQAAIAAQPAAGPTVPATP